MTKHVDSDRNFEISRRRWLGGAVGSLPLCGLSSGRLVGAEPVVESGTSATEGLRYDDEKTSRWSLGFHLDTPVTFTGGLATFPVPMDWPEQTVSLVSRAVDPKVGNIQLRSLPGGAQQVVAVMPRLLANSELEIRFEFEIAKRNILPADEEWTRSLVLPERPSRDLKMYLGNSPMIDASHIRVRMLSRELADRPQETAWQTVRQIYDTVRRKVKYREGPIRNASDALGDGKGDCEDMTSLFVALCRNARIPARMVWIPGHAYPEFYLQTATEIGVEPEGFWFPCQVAGSEQFGKMEEDRPILQKGDRFSVPEHRGPVRYVSEYFRCNRRGNGEPKIEFFREQVPPS